MFNRIRDFWNERRKEQSMVTAFGAILLYMGTLFKVEEAPIVADVIINNAEQIAGGEYIAPIMQAVGGLLIGKGVLTPDKLKQ